MRFSIHIKFYKCFKLYFIFYSTTTTRKKNNNTHITLTNIFEFEEVGKENETLK